MQKEFSALVEYTCRATSSHGASWYTSLHDKPKWRYLLFTVLLVLQFVLFFAFIKIMFLNPPDMIQSTRFTPVVNSFVPYVTFCSPVMFKEEKLKELSVTPNLAEYLKIAANPALTGSFGLYGNYTQAELELDEYMERTGNTSVDLLMELSLRCEDLIEVCKSSLAWTLSSAEECCKDFQSGPTLSPQGVCFTTSKPTKVNTALGFFTASSIVIKIQNTTDYEKGSLQLMGDGLMVAVHSSHTIPYAAILSNPIGIPTGQGVAIAVKESRIDRSEVRNAGIINSYISGDIGESCVSVEEDPVGELALEMGVPGWSKVNCNLFFLAALYSKCDLMSLWGMTGPRGDNLTFDFGREPDLEMFKKIPKAACTPNLIFESLSTINDSYLVWVSEVLIQRYCAPECVEVVYDLDTSGKSLTKANSTHELASIEVFFKSQTIEKHFIRMTGLSDRFAETGGLIGALIGASVITMIEFTYFYFLIAKWFIRHCYIRIRKLFSHRYK